LKTGKLGLKLSFFAVIIYLTCFFGSFEALLILCGFLILVEKDDWLSIHAFQALLLKSIYCLACAITNNIYSWINNYPLADSFTSTFLKDASHIHDTLIFIFGILLLIIIMIAALEAGKGVNVNIPFVSSTIKKMMNFKAFEVRTSQNTQKTESLNGTTPDVKNQENNEWYCSQCGSRNTTEFCVKCGTKKRNH